MKILDLNNKIITEEKDIQLFIEDKILELFNLKFIETEYTIKDSIHQNINRFDTLAISLDSNPTIQILEYKFNKCNSLFDQCDSYYVTLKNEFDKISNFIIKKENKDLKFDLKKSWVKAIVKKWDLTEHQKKAFIFKRKQNFELYQYDIFKDIDKKDKLLVSKITKNKILNKEDIKERNNNSKKREHVDINLRLRELRKKLEKENINLSKVLSEIIDLLNSNQILEYYRTQSYKYVIWVKNKETWKVLFNINIKEKKFEEQGDDDYITIIFHKEFTNKFIWLDQFKFLQRKNKNWKREWDWIAIRWKNEISYLKKLLSFLD